MDKIDKSKYTPMMQHYLQLKEENPDAIMMYRLGGKGTDVRRAVSRSKILYYPSGKKGL